MPNTGPEKLPVALKPPTTAVFGPSYLSAIGVTNRNFLDKLQKNLGDQWEEDYVTCLTLMNMRLAVAGTEHEWFENDAFTRLLTVGGAGVNAGLGANKAAFDIPLDANDIFTLNGVKYSFFQPTDVIRIPDDLNGGTPTQALITAVDLSVPKVTCKFTKTAWTTPAMPAGTTIMHFSDAHATGANRPKGRIHNFRNFTAKLQLLKGVHEADGSAMATALWFEIDGEQYPYLWSQKKVDYHLARERCNVWCFGLGSDGPDITDLTDTNNNEPIKFTEGIRESIRQRGFNFEYPLGLFDLEIGNEIANVADSVRAGSQMLWSLGIRPYQQVENALVDFNYNTAINWTNGTDEETMVKIGFKGFQKGGATYAFKKLGFVSDPNQFGAAGYSRIQNTIFVLPMGNTAVYQSANAMRVGGASTYTKFGYAYQAFGDMNREVIHVVTDGTGQTSVMATNHIDKQIYESRSHFGAFFIAATQGICGEGI